jgi:ABC-type Fe3+-siderophore transport system permease subunit
MDAGRTLRRLFQLPVAYPSTAGISGRSSLYVWAYVSVSAPSSTYIHTFTAFGGEKAGVGAFGVHYFYFGQQNIGNVYV